MFSEPGARERGLFVGWLASVLVLCVLLAYLYGVY